MSPESGSPTASPEKQALLHAFDSVLKSKADAREAERATAAARRQRRRASRLLMSVCASVALAAGLYVYVARPEWIFPPPAPRESVAVRDASLRITIASAAQHLDRFRQQTGQLPATLAQAGARSEGISYDRTAAGYRLSIESGELRVHYSSDEPLTRFVGNSFKVIARRSR